MVLKNPFLDRTMMHFVLIVIGIATQGILLIPYLAIILYLKKKRESYTTEVLRHEVNEIPKYQIRSYIQDIGFGQLGITENYLFFIPKNNNEEPILINVKYLTKFNARTVATSEFTSTKDFDGSIDSSPKKAPIFEVSGSNKDNLDFNYIWITGTVWNKGNKKLLEEMKKIANVPQDIYVTRKLI